MEIGVGSEVEEVEVGQVWEEEVEVEVGSMEVEVEEACRGEEEVEGWRRKGRLEGTMKDEKKEIGIRGGGRQKQRRILFCLSFIRCDNPLAPSTWFLLQLFNPVFFFVSLSGIREMGCDVRNSHH